MARDASKGVTPEATHVSICVAVPRRATFFVKQDESAVTPRPELEYYHFLNYFFKLFCLLRVSIHDIELVQ